MVIGVQNLGIRLYNLTAPYDYLRNLRRLIENMKKRYLPCMQLTKTLDSEKLRENFLIDDLFAKGEIKLYYIVECERAVIGSACPLKGSPLKLEVSDELRADYFCERRELSVLNLGAKGTVSVDGKIYELEHLELLYVSRGSKEIFFESLDSEKCAEFYLVSYPAHAAYPTTKSARGDANRIHLGDQKDANVRTINQVVCQARIPSCQLVTGFTQLEPGSVWNTMPSHTHERRSEIYLYFDIEPDQCVFHFMGDPRETRHLVVRNKQVVLSPSWSIHSGCGTRNYSFVWAMGGENQNFDDMDAAETSILR